MYLNRNKKTTLLSFATLFLLGGTTRLIDSYVPGLSVRPVAISFLSYCAICVLFISIARRNISYKRVRRYMILIAALFLFRKIDEMLIQNFFPISSEQTRILWYLQYFPTNIIPNCTLFTVLNARTRYGEPIHRGWYATMVISIALSFMVLTNDLHQLAFRFPAGISAGLAHFRFGPVYILSMVWIFFLFALSVWLLYKMAHVKELRRGIWFLVIAMIVGLSYTVWYSLGNRMTFRHGNFFSDVDIWILILLFSLEGAVRLGLIRSNFNYLEFFEFSTLAVQLEDRNGVRFQTESVISSTEEQRNEAMKHEVYLDEDHRFRGRPIPGGRVFWVEDLSEINRITRELDETRRRLQQENDLIKAENEMIARAAKADEQNRLYSMLAQQVQSQLDKIETVLQDTGADDPELKTKLARACVYKVFVKRFSNMELLAQEDNTLNLFELRSSLRESADYLRLNPGIEVTTTVAGKGFFRADALMLLYGLYQKVIEYELESLSRVHVLVRATDNLLFMDMDLVGKDLKEPLFALSAYQREIALSGGRVRVENGPDLFRIRVQNFQGG